MASNKLAYEFFALTIMPFYEKSARSHRKDRVECQILKYKVSVYRLKTRLDLVLLMFFFSVITKHYNITFGKSSITDVAFLNTLPYRINKYSVWY